MRHTGRRLGRQPLIPVALVEHLLGPVPAVVEILDEGERQVAHVGAERGHDGGPISLVPHRLAAGQHDRVGIPEPPHAAHHAEVMVERSVLLHEHHDVLDVLDAAGRMVRRNGESASDAVRQHRRRDAPARELKEPAPIYDPHPHHPRAVHGQRSTRCPALKDPEPPGSRARGMLGTPDRGVHGGSQGAYNPRTTTSAPCGHGNAWRSEAFDRGLLVAQSAGLAGGDLGSVDRHDDAR